MTDFEEGYEGEAIEPEVFRLRMEAQCTRIDNYRMQVLREQRRHLSRDEAALEWIAQYADSFEPETDNR